MREIKFRAWDRAFKTMVDVTVLEWHRHATNLRYIKGMNLVEEVQDGGGLGLDERFVLMQYTGLKDKNGIEIYEGDIVDYVAVVTRGMGGKWNEETAVVKYKTRESRIHGYEAYWWPFHEFNGCHHKDVEVIGNIYENSELLEG